MNPTGWLCGPRIYEFKGWSFEYGMTGAWPLRKDGELRVRAGRKFYAMLGEFLDFPEEKKAEYRTGGGCRQF